MNKFNSQEAKRLRALFCFALLGLISGCRTDFDLNENYKEIPVIYGLLTQKDSAFGVAGSPPTHYINDSVQYFRIGRTFLNEGGSALAAAKIQDSLYYGNELEATLEIGNAKYRLLRVDNIAKNPGTFAYPGQVVYRTPYGFRLQQNTKYTLRVRNTHTGLEAVAESEALGFITSAPQSQFRISTIGFPKGGSLPISWYSAKGARFYGLNLIFTYQEWNIADTANKKTIALRWPRDQYKLTSIAGGVLMGETINNNDIYTFLGQTIASGRDLRHKLQYVTIEIVGGGEEIYNFINVNRPSLGVVQKLNEYTNVKNGYGIFSNRTTNATVLHVAGSTIDELRINPQTAKLNFVK